MKCESDLKFLFFVKYWAIRFQVSMKEYFIPLSGRCNDNLSKHELDLIQTECENIFGLFEGYIIIQEIKSFLTW